jgi:hypothetical protein
MSHDRWVAGMRTEHTYAYGIHGGELGQAVENEGRISGADSVYSPM